MRKIILAAIAMFTMVNGSFAQPAQSSEERVRTSTVVPDLHNAANRWNKESGLDGSLAIVSYQGKTLTVSGSEEYYTNAKDKMMAYLWLKKDANGNKEEFAMLYGNDKVSRRAIKSGGKWYVSKKVFFDNEQSNLQESISPKVVYDDKDVDRPVKVKFVLETVVGLKEVVFDLQ